MDGRGDKGVGEGRGGKGGWKFAYLFDSFLEDFLSVVRGGADQVYQRSFTFELKKKHKSHEGRMKERTK